jgi:methionine biosynthesis protein MetW
MSGGSSEGLRPDLAAIAAMIRPGTRVLDVGCGDGALLEYLGRTKGVDGRGIELSQQNVNLSEYPSGAFDAVILSNTIQATERPRLVMEHLLRIGRRTAVSLPNFGYWKVRLALLATGRMPRTRNLDYSWFDTPNIHLCTLSDFLDLTRLCAASVVEAHALNEKGETRAMDTGTLNSGRLGGPNLTAPGAIFLLKKESTPTQAD